MGKLRTMDKPFPFIKHKRRKKKILLKKKTMTLQTLTNSFHGSKEGVIIPGNMQK